MARLQERVVLPSPCRALVTAMTRAGSWTSTKRRLVRSLRTASARAEVAASPTISGALRALASNGISPSSGLPVARCRPAASRSRTSATPRRIARPMPRIRPTRPPRVRLRTGCGETGSALTRGPLTISILMGVLPSGVVSTFCTSSTNLLARLSVTRNARVWSVSVTDARSRTVPVSVEVLTRRCTSSAVRPTGVSATTLCASRSLLSRSAYDLTRCWRKRPP